MAGTRLPNEHYTIGWFCNWTPFNLEHVKMFLDQNHYESEEDEEMVRAHGIHQYILGRMESYNVVIFFLSPGAEGSEVLSMSARAKMQSDFPSVRFSFMIGLTSCCSFGVKSRLDTSRTKIGDVMICSRGLFRYRSIENSIIDHVVTLPPVLILKVARHIRLGNLRFRAGYLEDMINYERMSDPYFRIPTPALSFGKIVTNTPPPFRKPPIVGRVECDEDLGNVFYPEPGTQALAESLPGIVIKGIADFDSDSSRPENDEYHATLTSIMIAKFFLSYFEEHDK